MLGKGYSQSLQKDPFAALRHNAFRKYIMIRTCFTFANTMQDIVIGFYIYQITRSVFAIGLLGLTEVIPAIGFALYGGYIADKSDRRKILLLVSLGALLSSLILFLVTQKSHHGYIHINMVVLIIYSMIFFNGIFRAFYSPAMFVIAKKSVPKEIYANSSTWTISTRHAASVLGPVVGGLIYGFYGISITFIIILIFLCIALIPVFLLKPQPPEYLSGRSVRVSFAEGLNFVFKNETMLRMMTLDTFAIFFGGSMALLPVFANDILRTGPEGLGIMRATLSSGYIVMMLVMTRFSPMNKAWRNLLISATGFGCAVICFALSNNFYISLLFLFAQGVFDSIGGAIRGTIMQLLTPEEMGGRVSAVNSIFMSSANEIGEFESGTAAKLMGIIPSVIFGGCMTLVVVAATYIKTKKMIRLSLDEISSRRSPTI